MRHTPHGRGYSASLGYFHHANDYYTEGIPFAAIGTENVCGNRFVDLWHAPNSAPYRCCVDALLSTAPLAIV